MIEPEHVPACSEDFEALIFAHAVQACGWTAAIARLTDMGVRPELINQLGLAWLDTCDDDDPGHRERAFSSEWDEMHAQFAAFREACRNGSFRVHPLDTHDEAFARWKDEDR